MATAALLYDPLPSGTQKMKRLLMILLLGVLWCGSDTTKSVASLEKFGDRIKRNEQGEIVEVHLSN